METQADFRQLSTSELLNVIDQRYGKHTSPLMAELAARLKTRPDNAAAMQTARERVGGIINMLEESKPFDLMGELRKVEEELDV